MAEKTALTRPNDVARLRADIEETRASMGDTLNAIQERLSPERLKAQARESIREATIGRVEKMARKAGDKAGDAGRGLMDVARENPVPLALIGIGAGWLLYNSKKRSSNGAPRGYVPEERAELGYEGAYVSESGVPVGAHEESIAQKVSTRVSEVGETVKARASETAQHISDVTHRVEDVAGSVAGSVRSTVSDGVHRAEETAETVGSRARSKYEETPWFGAAVAIALGAAAGLSLPATRREQDAFGEKRDELVNRAREMGREKLQAVRRVAEEVVEETREAVREHAREEGLAMEPPSRVGDTGLGI